MREKKRPRKKPSQIEVVKILETAKQERKRLTINGIYLPEKEDKSETSVKSYRIKNEKYDKFYKLCVSHNISMNEALNAMIDNFLNENTNE